MGYDIRVNDSHSDIGWYVTPFVEGNYLFDQMKAEATTTDRTWNTLTARAGVAIEVQF